jgi:CRISPR-associated protein Cmr4
MQCLLIGLLAETSVHCGATSEGGVIDLPVAREAVTRYPCIVGSGVKGALRSWAGDAGMSGTDVDKLFGKTDNAGCLLVSDARLLLLPVRSLDSSYRWVTCPYILERLSRDIQRSGAPGLANALLTQPAVDAGSYLGRSLGASLFLEERQFSHLGEVPTDILEVVSNLLPAEAAHTQTRHRLQSQCVVVHDDDFAWFADNSLPVMARNVLDDETKVSRNLWYEESLPPDTLLYLLIAERSSGALADIQPLLVEHPYLRLGGNETTGMGWFATHIFGIQGRS